MRKKATIYDIAKLSNTSSATVSRVLNDKGYPVKKELKERVLAASEELNYMPNLIGRQLKTNESNEIGIIIPSISNPYYALLVAGVEYVARKSGYKILLCNTNRDSKIEDEYLDYLFQKQIKGIVISSITKDVNHLSKLQANGVEVVAFEQDIDLPCSKINFDYFRGGYIATKHLIENGHKDIGFIGAPLTRYSRTKVFEGFIQCLKDNEITENQSFFKIAETENEFNKQGFEYQNGKDLVLEMIRDKTLPTAILCINDMTAFGVIQSLQKNGFKVPDDISVIGFDNINTSEMIYPPLTTIDQCTYEMGMLAAEALVNNLQNNTRKHTSTLLQPTLVIRESTRSIK